MTSSAPRPRECFVFVHLPGQSSPVVCGRFEQRGSGRDLVGLFTYGRSYLKRSEAVSIDPIGLPLGNSTFPPTDKLRGIYGALRDASPDAWGRRVIEAAMGKPEELTEVEYLLTAGNDRAGALVFGTDPKKPPPIDKVRGAIELPALVSAAEQLEEAEASTPELKRAAELLLHGVTMGGARPKASIVADDKMWLAKFPAKNDRVNLAAIEAGLLTMARRCGLRVPEHRTVSVGGKPVFMVERFDREGPTKAPTRARYLSGLTLLDADEMRGADWSYLRLAEEVRRRSSTPREDCRELFGRAVYNALVSNGDDHPRNHAIIAWGADDWRLSPLFDVVPTEPAGSQERLLALIVGNALRRASRANLVSASVVFGVETAEAHAIIDAQKARLLEGWEGAVKHHGATQADIDAIRHAIVPVGFEDSITSV